MICLTLDWYVIGVHSIWFVKREMFRLCKHDYNVTTTWHNVNFEHASVICLQPNTTKRKISEALLIKAHTVVHEIESNTPSISLAIFWNVTIFSCFHFIFTAPDDGRWLRPKYRAFAIQLKADHFKKLDLEIWMKFIRLDHWMKKIKKHNQIDHWVGSLAFSSTR